MPDRSSEPVWFEAQHIIRMNEKIVAARGESHLVLNHGMIESALTRPVNLFLYEGVTDLFVLALRLLEAIGKNHCFEQGNKRTAHMAGFLFLTVNGAPFEQMDDVAHAKLLSRLITGKVGFDDVVSWCRPNSP